MSPAAASALYAFVIGLPSILIAYLGYRRSRKVDAITAQAGVVTETRAGTTEGRAGTAQIIEGQNQLIENLQADNLLLREAAKENIVLRRKLNRMNRLYGDNGNGGP